MGRNEIKVNEQYVFEGSFAYYRHRFGEVVTVEEVIDKPDARHDEEVLPMFRVRFEDGERIEVWADELADIYVPEGSS